jgi:hypothetical protein
MKLVLVALLTVILVSSTVLSHVDAKSKDSKAKDKIIKAIGKAVEGRYSQIKLIQLSKSNVSGYILAYNTTKTNPPVPIPTPTPTPTPVPSGPTTKVCLVGDLKGSTVPNLLEKGDCNYKIGLGDLGYKDTLSYFKGLNFNKCLIGNHDSTENGNDAIYKEALAYCGDSWYIKAGQAAILFGFNTNGNLDNQLAAAKQVPMTGIKSVFVLSHKPCYTSPNSHHPVESRVKAFCDSLAKVIPSGIKVYYIAAHNHQLASTVDGTKFIAGGGGRSHYDCGTDSLWNFCDNTHYGFLELTIGNSDGATTAKFIK